jgi:hypothetical protein
MRDTGGSGTPLHLRTPDGVCWRVAWRCEERGPLTAYGCSPRDPTLRPARLMRLHDLKSQSVHFVDEAE